MNDFWYWFWTAMVFCSIAWYFFLLFYVGFKGGLDVLSMAQSLAARPERKD
jgi:hypothetical protein